MNLSNQRELIFISHATPDDNEFTLWLSTRLKLAGYQVWSDVTQLFGGEKFWNDIEEAISDYACKFIIVITRTSLSKPGVQKEVEYALETEKSYLLSNFIIPIIIDDSSFSSQPYGFPHRNIIPFRNGWAEGFGRLIERFSRDNVPRSKEKPVNLGVYLADQTASHSTLVEEADIAATNWLSVEGYPKDLNFYRLPIKSDKFRSRFSDFPYPWFEYGGNFSSFCGIEDMKKALFEWESPCRDPALDIESVLKGEETKYSVFERHEVVKKINFMLSDAWSKAMRKQGLHCYAMSNGKEAFFFPDDHAYRGMLKFPDIHGVIRRRSIVGFSVKNNVFWHFAIGAKPIFGFHPKLCLVPHIVFTEDGKSPLQDKDKMHRLRRGFCKNWWNDRWRDMLLAYLYQISRSNEIIELDVGSSSKVTLSARPIMLDSPVSIILESGLSDSPNDVDVVDIALEEANEDASI